MTPRYISATLNVFESSRPLIVLNLRPLKILIDVDIMLMICQYTNVNIV